MSLKKTKSSIKTPLAKARGLGAAGHGSAHWMAQRVTAIANIPLVIWLVYSILSLVGADYAAFTDWLAQPLHAVPMILFIASVFYHAALGLQVVIEDYVSCECKKITSLIGVKLGLFALAVAAIFSILKVAL